MVYKKGALSRYSRGPKFLPGRSVAKTASKALYVASKVARALNVEKKYHQGAANGNFSLGTQIIPLNNIGQGDGGTDRDGDQMKILNMAVRVNLANTGTDPKYFRAMIVQDKQADGTAPTISEILDSTTGQLSQQFMNLDNKFRFKILKDLGVQMLEGKDSSGGSRSLSHKEAYVRLSDKQCIKTRYSGTGNTVADIASNPVYLILICDNSLASAEWAYSFRLRFVDN